MVMDKLLCPMQNGTHDEWSYETIDNIIIDISMGPFGSDIKVENFKRQGIPVLNGFNVNSIVVNDAIENFVTPAKAISLKKAVAVRGDVVITHRGTIGQIAVIPKTSRYDKYVISQSQFRVTFDCKKINPLFLVYYFHSTEGQHNLLEKRGYTGVPALAQPTTNFRKLTVSLPPLPEQRLIAEALSDTDNYIAALERIIAKKRNIKQGAMQELLTGKKRLPEFSGEWVEKRIDEIADTASGGTPSRLIPAYYTGNIPWVTTSELNDSFIYSTNERITNAAVANSSAKLFPQDTILMAMYGATIGKLGVLKCDAATNQACCAFSFENKIDADFMYNVLLFNRPAIIELGSGAGQPNISQTIIKQLIFTIPATKAEQTAIASILSDMDAEIAALTAKLNKARLIKQGMMQELLTGRIRLVKQTMENSTAAKVMELPKREPKAAAQTGGHSQQFDDAVMIAGIVNVLYSDKFLLGRKKVQKCLYLLRRYQDESTAAFKKKAAGPYADEVRYKGGEPIAKSAKYISTTTAKGKGKGTIFAPGSDISKALGYINSWGKQNDIQWVANKLKFKKGDELELLATVDMAICDLEDARIPVSVTAIKHLIATNEEWKAKLEKQTFSDVNIARAIRELQTLLNNDE
ncbi:MAG: restriction endonuclease subunit S [Azoarcus sp.]|jgi:type I restriction enzyme S subunit|nr:restriction endonuclease subunit S [Azoarcus sp.]